LAEREHERWMRELLAIGWRYSSETDKPRKLHKCLQSWEELPEEEKEKDRALVRGIPIILAKSGYAIEKVSLKKI